MSKAVFAILGAVPILFAQSPAGLTKMGHSIHGETYDVGPRQKPWLMDGIGTEHFPITTSNPEAQKWFDQGNALLASFWDYEAERSFRWVLKLDPECAMGYWGLARVTDHNGDKERRTIALREAEKRMSKVSERERMYIQAWVEHYREDPAAPKTEKERDEVYRHRLEEICWKYPDDLEAKSLYALANLWDGNHLGSNALLDEIIAKEPRHPGANHYKIHLWIGPDATHALDSSAIYGDIAPAIGHAQHMPGHIYSHVGMWNEAAISMDKATRVEAAYMRDHLAFPFNTWNYAHNRNYLCYIQEQLGMADAAIQGARSLLASPYDPKYNKEKNSNRPGKIALLRVLIRYERWKEILDSKDLKWTDDIQDKMLKEHAQALAHIGLGQIPEAEENVRKHQELRKEVEKDDNKWLTPVYETQAMEIKGRLMLAHGDTLNGLAALSDAAAKESKLRDEDNDPPFYANIIYDSLGRAYLDQKSPSLAVAAFEKALAEVKNDGFALAGLAESYHAMGDMEKARDTYGRLLYVWAQADPSLKWMDRVKALGLTAEPRDESPRKQRVYRSAELASYGPLLWEPYRAPLLDAVDSKGKRVTLEDYKGKNVLLIFYLGDECPHCLEQLVQLAKRAADFSRESTEILAVSKNSPEHNRESLKMGEVPFRLLSDEKLENMKRFLSYDDFEDLELHSTILIDKNGRVIWSRNGGDPFTDFDFLVNQIKRANQM